MSSRSTPPGRKTDTSTGAFGAAAASAAAASNTRVTGIALAVYRVSPAPIPAASTCRRVSGAPPR